jgi:beta-lactamase regulating signal transducer with metallopeptidase domain/biopolymer transport protein ExbD
MKTFLTLAGHAFDWTWKTSLAAAALVILVVLTQALLSRWLTPRLRYTLSLLIFIRLLLPMAPSSRLSLENLFHRSQPTRSVAAAPIAPATSDAPAISQPVTAQSAIVATPATKTVASSTPHLKLVEWLTLAWAAGFLVLLTSACWRYAQWKRLIRHAQVITDPALLELLETVRAGIGVSRPIQLLAVPRLNSPAVFGVRRVCLLLPEEAATRLSAEELRMVFLHEMAHIRRHDMALDFLLIALQYLHWFNPLIWIAGHRIRADRELVCDSIVMENMQAAQRPHYGKLLLKLLEEFSAPVAPQAIAVISSKHEIKRRLIMIKQHRTGTLGAASATLLAIIALCSATFTHADNTPAAGSTTWSYWNTLETPADGKTTPQKIGSFYAVAGTARETVAVGIDGRIATRNNATGQWTVQTLNSDALLPGVDQSAISVTLAATNTLFENQPVSENDLPARLNAAMQKNPRPTAIVIIAEKVVNADRVVHLADLAHAAGFTNLQLSTQILNDPDFRAIVYAKDQYVVVREKGSIMTSPDGLQWTSQSSPTKSNLLGLFWDGHQYLAGGDFGTILSSPDGITWTPRVSHTRVSIYGFAYSGSLYVAVGNDGISTSPDSINWTEAPNAPAHVPFTACVWTGDEFLACGLGLDRNPTIYTSPDGQNWTLRNKTITASLRAAATINGAIYVAGDSVIAKSTDGGTTWTNTFNESGGNKLFMGLATTDNSLIAAGFNHNVWAFPTGTAQ